MSHSIFDRPREKLQRRGVAFLTLTELVQLILGSGSSYSSVAKLSRFVAKLSMKGELTLEQLATIKGIGMAKASQLLAAVEFGKRLTCYNHEAKQVAMLNMQTIITQANHKNIPTLLIYFFDGHIRQVATYELKVERKHVLLAAQEVAELALTSSARSVVVVLVDKKTTQSATLSGLRAIKAINEGLQTIAVRLEKVYRTDGASVQEWHAS